ncbi:MAG: TIR domain-containing protein [Chloroflexi bacterium]|nr:TIR domain-containing protein [Chloroflexota bacterium]
MADDFVYLGYVVSDGGFAAQLAADLKNRGVRVWIDSFELDPRTLNENGPAVRQDAIARCCAGIIVLSPAFVEQRQEELALLAARNVTILPVLSAAVAAWPSGLRRDRAILASAWQDKEVYQAALGAILDSLRQRASSALTQPPESVDQYLNALLARIYRGLVGYIPLGVHAEPLDEDDADQPTLELGAVVKEPPRLPGAEDASDEDEDEDDPAPAADETGLIPLPSILAVADLYSSFALLGAAGTGKTTTLHHLVAVAVWDYRSDPTVNGLPVYADLSSWREGTRLRRYLEQEISMLPGSLAVDWSAVTIFLDGFDQLGPRNRQVLAAWLDSDECSETVVIASRAASYTGELGLPLVVVDTLDHAHIRQFAQQFLPSELREPFVAQLSLPSRSPREKLPLGSVPFLLMRLMQIFEAHPHAALPVQLGAAMRASVRARWVSSVAQGQPGWIAYDEMIERFSGLAASMIDEDETVGADLAWAAVKIGGRRRWLRSGPDEDALQLLQVGYRLGLLDIDRDTVRFSHRLYLAYFAGEALTRQGIGDTVDPPVFDPKEYRRLPGRWDQAVQMACHLVEQPGSLLVDVLRRDPYLAGLTVTTGIRISDDVLAKIRSALTKEFDRGDWRQTRAAIQALRSLGEAHVVEIMIEYMAYGDLYERRIAAWALGEIAHPAAVPVLVEALGDDDVREFVIPALVRIGKPAVAEVSNCLDPAEHERWETRAAAAQVLQQIGDVAAFPALLGGIYDPEYEVRWSVANALASYGEPAVDGLVAILEDPVSIKQFEGDVYRAAASAAAWTGNERAIRALIHELQDADLYRRAIAVETLGETGSPLAVEPLIDCLGDHRFIEPDGDATEDETIAEIAALSLQRIGTPEALAAVQRWQGTR